ncbi:unnamed protein product [Ixodes pacificus]
MDGWHGITSPHTLGQHINHKFHMHVTRSISFKQTTALPGTHFTLSHTGDPPPSTFIPLKRSQTSHSNTAFDLSRGGERQGRKLEHGGGYCCSRDRGHKN